MNTLVKLEIAIGKIVAEIEENNRIDRITKEKLVEQISNLWNITGELKEERENTFESLQEILRKL